MLIPCGPPALHADLMDRFDRLLAARPWPGTGSDTRVAAADDAGRAPCAAR